MHAPLEARFEMSCLGRKQQFLGLNVECTNDGIYLSQHAYIESVIMRFPLLLQDAASPLDPSTNLFNGQVKDNELSPRLAKDYLSLLGCLIWISSSTRPDLSYTASVLARFKSRPLTIHWNAMLRVLSFLKATQYYARFYSRNASTTAPISTVVFSAASPSAAPFSASSPSAGSCSTPVPFTACSPTSSASPASVEEPGLIPTDCDLEVLSAFTDSDWASDTSTRKSQGGFVLCMGQAAVIWKSKPQSCVLSPQQRPSFTQHLRLQSQSHMPAPYMPTSPPPSPTHLRCSLNQHTSNVITLALSRSTTVATSTSGPSTLLCESTMSSMRRTIGQSSYSGFPLQKTPLTILPNQYRDDCIQHKWYSSASATEPQHKKEARTLPPPPTPLPIPTFTGPLKRHAPTITRRNYRVCACFSFHFIVFSSSFSLEKGGMLAGALSTGSGGEKITLVLHTR